jgi:predicted HicB family RNase H-like nuclease
MERMSTRIQIVARIDPALRKAIGRVVRRAKTTLNAVIEAALARYVAAHTRPSDTKGV